MEEGTLRLGHGPEEPNHDDKRMTHNMVEKRRKDRIKQWISHIAQLLPPASSQGPDKPSTLDIMERAANYIIELKASYEKLLTEQGDAVLVEEMHKMRTELDQVRAERDRLAEVLNAAGIAALNDTSQWRGSRKSTSNLTENGSSPAAAVVDAVGEVAAANGGSDESRSKNKSNVSSSSKRRNTISVHLEQQKLQQEQQQQQQQQAMAQAMASGLLPHNGGLIYGQNLMVNPNLMVSPTGQVVVSGSHQTTVTPGSASSATISALDGSQRDATVYGLEKNTQSGLRGVSANVLGGGSIGGLLQIAMQDAGITPSLQLDASRQSSPAPVSELTVHSDSAPPDSDVSRTHAPQQSLSLEDVGHDALQTLASVASNTVSSSMSLFPSLASSVMMGMMTGSASLAASTVTVTSSAMNQNTPIMSVGQLSQLQQQHQQPSQASLMMGMPVLNPLAPNAGLGMVAPNAGQNPGAMGIMPSGAIGQHGQLSMIQGAAGPGGLVPGSILMNQQGQLLVINENGIPILMQQPLDPSIAGLGDKTVIGAGGVSVSTNSGLMGGGNPTISLFDHQQQALISSGALTITKSDPNASAGLGSGPVSHPQSSILAGMNPQTAGQMNFLGSQILPQGALQSLAVQSGGQLGGLLQPGATVNQQLMQSLGISFPGMLTGAAAGGGMSANPANQAPHGIAGNAAAGAAAAAGGPGAAGSVLFPGGQAGGMVTLNTVPTNPHQLPSALVLPTGHVIPVVSNPQLLTTAHGGGGLMSMAPGGGGGLNSTSAGATSHIQLQQMGGGAGASQVIQVDPNNPAGAQVFIGPNGLQMTTTPAGQTHLTQQQQLQQLLQQQNLNILMPSAAISASQTIPTTTVVTLASTVVPASAAKNVLAKAQMQTTQVLMQRNASQTRSHTTSATIARKGSQTVKTSTSETQTSASSAGLLVQTGCSGTSAGSTGNVQVNSVASNSCNPGANSNSAGAGSAPVLLMMQHNGQLLNVLVDPVTLQVLNSGQTAVQTTQSVGAVVSNSSGDKSTTNSSVHTSVTTSGSKKSSKKSGSQRTATPKPKSSKASVKASSASATPTTTSSCSQTVMSRTNASCSVTTSVTQPLVINTDGSWDSQAGSNIMICDETNNPAADDGALAPSSDNQDILAKAAQSIFTASPTEMTSPIGGAFYNPAHDDNPLLIDTSPAGPDTDMPSSSSPKKSISAASAAAQSELAKSVDCQQQQQQQHSQMLREQEAMLRQQEQQEQEKLMQQEREQHEQLMRHIEQHQHQMGLGSPETLSLIPPSMPSLTTSDVRASLSAAVSVAVGEPCAAAVNVTSAAAQLIPPPKKPKKSKSKKKDKEKEDCREKDADGSKSSKKSSKKKKKEQEAAIRRQEEINQQQQQLILQQQQQQQEEQAKLQQQQQHEQEQLLLLQQHQQQQEQESPGLMSEPQLVQPSATDMMVDDVPDHVVSGAADPFVLPDSITFTESEISDVLDQVEKLGSSLVSDEQLKKYEKVDKPEKRDKKSKRRKDGQMDDSSSNPNKKQCKEPNRESDGTIDANLFVLNQQLGVRPLSQPQQQEDPNSSSRMSIYDFQDDSPPGLGAAKTESPTKSKNKKSKSKAPTNTQNLLAATSPLSGSAISSATTVVTITATVTTTSTTTTSAGTNTPASSLDLLVPALSQAKSDASSSASKGSKSSKSKKSDKKDRTKASNASTMANSLNNMNAVNSANSMNAAARVNSAATDSMSIQTNGTISSSKSNDSLSSNSVDSASVILPMPGFDTLEALNSPPPLISPPVSQSKSAASSSGSKDQGQGQLQGQSMDGSLGQISSIVSSDIVTTMCSTSIETLADISDVVPTSNTMSIDPLMLPGANSPPPALHHPMTLSHNNTNSLMVQQQQQQQQQKQKQHHQQQQQQNISNKQRQQTPPRHSSSQQMPSHSPQISQSSQSGPSQGHAHMGPPTSPAQAVGRPRSTSLSHQQQQNQTGGFLSSSPQSGGGVRQSPSASCISPSSSHSRGSHENQGFGQAAGAHLAPTQSPSSSSRLGDMTGLISPDISCPNANLFNSPAPKLSHMQKSTSQGKPSCTEDSAASRSRTGIYSADNFVQPSRQTSNLESCSQQSSNNTVPGNMSRMPGINDANGESFNFTSIGLNLTSSSTQSTGPEMGVASSAGMPFSFSLTSASTTQTSSSSGSHGQVGHPSFPFYPLHPSVTQPSGTSQQSHQTQSLSMMPPGVDHRMDGQPGHQTSGPGVGAGAMSSTGQNGFNFGGLMDLNSSCSGGRDTAMPGDQSHLLSSVDKSPMGGFTQHHGGGGAGGGSGTNSGQKRLSEIQPPPPPSNRPPQQPTQPLDHGPPINRSPQQMGNHTSPAGNYFSSTYPSSASLNTPPLRHPPLPNTDSNHLMNRGFDHGFGASQTSTSVPLGGPSFDHHGMSYPRDMNQTRPLEHVSAGASTSSRKPSSQSQQQQNGGGSKQQKQSQSGGGGSGGINRVPPSHNQSANMPPSQTSTHGSSQSQQNSATSQAPPPAHQTSGNGQPPAPSPSQQARQAKRKQPSSQSKKSKPTYSTEIDANLSHSIFDNNQSLQSFFSFQNMSPPPVRNLQSEGPSFLPGNLFGSTSRPLSNSSNKNTPDLGPPYALFPPTRPQNGLGLNFQHSFGMNTMTGNPGSGHMTPHSVAVPPHMGNFSLSNIFSDGGTNDGGINISPIKFSHPGNPILPPQAGMDPNALQHPHQGTALYHNRSHHGQPHVLPNPMTLNSILGHNHHGFDTRSMGQGINSSVGPPFHGAGHPSSFAIPPLNFSMHDH